jgi:predicted GIY-YIG superfamily endonuclease
VSREERYTVYFCYDAGDTLLYVGVSGNVDKRLGQHKTQSAWWPEVARVEQEHYTTPEAAGQREHTIMHSLAPRHNRDLALQVLKRRSPEVRLDLRLPDELHAAVQQRAKTEHRSINQQIVYMLTDHVEREQAAQGNYDNQMLEYREHRRRGLARLAADTE